MMLDIHACSLLTAENEKLKMRLRKLKRQNKALELDLRTFQEKQKFSDMMRQFVTTRDAQVQTDPPKTLFSGIYNRQKTAEKAPTTGQDVEKTNKLLNMHNNLMKRYERELKTNMQHVETITTLNCKLSHLEQKLREHEQQQRMATPRAKSRQERSPNALGMRKQIKKLEIEKEKLKKELSGLDHGFFDEVEDIKFALQQSAKLNQEYEKALKKMCKQFGVPYPKPERLVNMPT